MNMYRFVFVCFVFDCVRDSVLKLVAQKLCPPQPLFCFTWEWVGAVFHKGKLQGTVQVSVWCIAEGVDLNGLPT